MKKDREIPAPASNPNSNISESADAKYWREKYEISTKHLMVAVKEWGRLRQQIEESRSNVA